VGKARATLGGQPLAGTVSWGLTTGVRPFVTTVTMSRGALAALLASGAGAGGASTPGGGSVPKKPVDLVLSSGGRSKTFRGIYILHQSPGPSPAVAAVTIADRRWLWPNCLYRRFLNIRRKSGTKRLLSPNALDPMTIDPKFIFARWSLIDREKRWTAPDLLSDLGDALARWEKQETGETPDWNFSGIVDSAALPIQDLELDSGLDAAIERALAYLPGMDVYVTAEGAVRFFWRTDEKEMDEIRKAGPEVQFRGHIEPISFARTRPRKVRVYFDAEVELAFRHVEAANTGATSDRPMGVDDLFIENVLPIPDPTLSVGGVTMTTGTYITHAEAYVAWGALPGIGQALDFPLVCAAFVPYQNLWNAMLMLGAASPRVDWAARIGSVQQTFRQTFRINPAWTDRISDLRAYRVATINTETGSRGDATVFSDFCYVASMRSLLAEQLNDQSIGYCLNVATYPTDDTIADDDIAAPATVTVDDAEQGIFSVSYVAELFSPYQATLPSQIELQGANTQPGHVVAATQAGPSPFLGRGSNRPLGFNVLGQYDSPPQLTASHKLIAILTAVPASPNSKKALVYVDILPGQVAPFPGSDTCDGPMLEVHVGAAIETARVAWIDRRAADIRQFFTQEAGDPGPNDAFPLADLVVNYGESAGGAASLFEIAKAEAARIWHAQRDRSVGSATFGFRGDAEIRGAITGVHHELSVQGSLTTRYDLPGRLEPLSILRYLSGTVLRIIRRLINPGK